MNTDGSNQKRLTDNISRVDSMPSWSPDGKKIAFASSPIGKEGDRENWDVYTMNPDGTSQTKLTNDNNKNMRNVTDISPNWTPDGKIGFVTNRDDIGGDFSDIYVMNSDGTNPTRITNTDTAPTQPAWSPDGKKIVFVYALDISEELLPLYTMNSDGTKPTILTKPDKVFDWNYGSPDWGPRTTTTTTTSTSTTTTHPSPSYPTGTPNLSNELNLSKNSGGSVKPEIAKSGSSFVYVIWRDFTTNGAGGDILFKRSTDGGKTFGSTINLSNNAGISEDAKIVATGPYVYVVWSDESASPGKGEIYFRASSNNGASFGSIKNLSSNSGGDSAVPQLRADGATNVYVVWSDDNGAGGRDIYLKRSTNNGVDFGSSKIKISTSGKASQPTISSQGSFVYIAWRDRSTGSGDIYFKRSTNAGSSFSSSFINLSNNGGDSTLPLIRSTGIFVYIAWRDASTGNGDIYFKRSTDNGATMQSLLNISADSKVSGNTVGLTNEGPDMDVSGTNVYVTWANVIDDTDPDLPHIDILVRKISSNGATLNPIKNISNDDVINHYPRISASGNYVYVTWIRNPDSEETLNTYISGSTDAGITFSAPPVLLSSGESGQGGLGVTSNMIPEVTVASSSTGLAYVVSPELVQSPNGASNMEIIFRIAN